MKHSTFNRYRSFAGLFLLVILFCGANYYLELGFFGRGAKGALILASTPVEPLIARADDRLSA
jgi:hypothetical protein